MIERNGVLNAAENNAFDVLEFGSIRDRIRDCALSGPGRALIEKQLPFSEIDPLKGELDCVTQMRDILRYDDAFPLEPFPDFGASIRRIQVPGTFLTPEDLLSLWRFLVLVRSIHFYLSSRIEKAPLLWEIGDGLVPHKDLETEIGRVLDSSGQVKDDASDALRNLRRSLFRHENKVRERLESVLHDMIARGYAQEDTLVFREGRLLVPMKESHRGHLKGVVVDQSASGATVFVEPLEVLELHNEIRRLHGEEKKEIERILRDLTDLIRVHSSDIETDCERMARLDALYAKGRFSLIVGGTAADIDEGGYLRFKEARHPILLLKWNKERVVPLDLEMGDPVKTLVITGPNAGGKTVTLKTVGLLSLMHGFGCHVPAAEGTRIPLFHAVFADIGDRQSLEHDLSTFSSHIKNIKIIIDRADSQSLVLLDEIGAATDPDEGSALAQTILKTLTDRGSFTVATTHMGSLKVFAHEEPGLANGSMVFDRDTLKPTYEFRIGIPGSSYAFEIAQRLGIPEPLVENARRLLGDQRGGLDRLLSDLEKESRKVHALSRDASIKESKLDGLIRLTQDRLDRLNREADSEKQKIIEEAQHVLGESNALVERVVREIRETQAAKEVLRDSRKAMQAQKEVVGRFAKKETQSRIPDLSIGASVLWPGHPGQGRVVSEANAKGRMVVQWADVRISVPGHELQPVAESVQDKPKSGMTSYESERSVRDELDLRGLAADEAIDEVDTYLGNAVMQGYSQVRIIHGKGTGVLRREIRKFLTGHRLVKNHRLGDWNEGDTGVTVVELK